tara:strand:+ start:70 stop:318 length:249 start_codon:yes stop_codon:yes gene_type:complete
MNNKKYIVILMENSNGILFSQVDQQNAQSMRRSLSNLMGLISYRVEPSFITDGSLPYLYTIMNQDECLALMATSDWSTPDPE